jgi:hypothetical protein
LCVINFNITPLSTLKVFNVSLPDSFLGYALPLTLLWFSLNYFYYLYAEYTQWRSSFISDVDVPDGMEDQSWKTLTLVPEITSLTNRGIAIKAEFKSGVGYAKDRVVTKQETEKGITELMGHISNQVMSAIQTDVARIDAFSNAIKNFNRANQFRFYVLDIFVPVIMNIISGYYLFWGANHI